MGENKDLPAFARSATIDRNASQIGLTKLELIAAMAMQGMLANSDLIQRMTDAGFDAEHQADFLSIAAIEQADSILNKLSK